MKCNRLVDVGRRQFLRGGVLGVAGAAAATVLPAGQAQAQQARAMLDCAHKLTVAPAEVGDADRARLRKAGFTERAIWDIAEVAAFFNFTNRLATATDMMPNTHYHAEAR